MGWPSGRANHEDAGCAQTSLRVVAALVAPRAMAQAIAALVRCEIATNPDCATGAMMAATGSLAFGKSTARNLTPRSSRASSNATLRDRRAGLAIAGVAPAMHD